MDLLKRNGCSYCTPIYIAILSGHEGVVDLLIQNGADTESLLGPWANPLQAAAQSGQLLAVRRLIAGRVASGDPPERFQVAAATM